MDEIDAALGNLESMRQNDDPRRTCPYCGTAHPETVADDDERTGVTPDGSKAEAVVTLCCKQYAVLVGDDLEKLDTWAHLEGL